MNASRLVLAGAAVALMLSPNYGMAADTNTVGSKNVKHVLLLSIDGMHAVDFYNCVHGIADANGEDPYCPNIGRHEQELYWTSRRPSLLFLFPDSRRWLLEARRRRPAFTTTWRMTGRSMPRQ